MAKTKGKRAAPKRRNIIHRHAKLRSGAGVHKTKRRQDIVTDADWAAADYAQYADYRHEEARGMEQELMQIQNEIDGIPPKPVEMSLVEFRNEHNVFNGTDLEDALKEWAEDKLVPSLCWEGCETHKDAYCSHGCPSIFVRLGRV